MSNNSQVEQIMDWVRRLLLALCLMLGMTFTAFNLAAFKTDQYGIYYQDNNQYWLAFGVAMLTISWLINNWKRI